MATDAEIARKMTDYLQARGFTCGRNYADIAGVSTALAGQLPNETESTLTPKIRSIVRTPSYGFKTTGKDDVSASDPKCGN